MPRKNWHSCIMCTFPLSADYNDKVCPECKHILFGVHVRGHVRPVCDIDRRIRYLSERADRELPLFGEHPWRCWR
jgi:hypothetical protein